MGIRLVPTSVTLNDLERRNGNYFALFRRIRYSFVANYVKVVDYSHQEIFSQEMS